MDIAFDEQSLAVKYDEDIDDTLAWEDVTRISGYKVYAYPGELTFLAFETSDGEILEVSDEMSGWLELVGALHNIFKLSSNWEEELADCEPGGEDITLFTK
ncbi:hypothetical protein FHW36_102510 [Chitinophaga polysaccharea]|uniref:Uncharacterized protein n=1 Tax=Chitinophaga polysaccharea TaxID=1293035 RepID=A0A561PXA6_9BACT|nr:hypothetical protein [Chitinophaga polysaccharea]TWF42749.1 hypothetical protein FHW36_102510 [Chitinophaga polysaccharea]